MYSRMQVCISESVCVCWSKPYDRSVWVTDRRPFPLMASSLFSTVQLEKKKVSWSSDEFFFSSTTVGQSLGAAMKGSRANWLPASGAATFELSVIARGDYGRLKWLEMLSGAHSTSDSSYIQQRPGGCNLGWLWFRVLQPQWLAHSDSHVFISYEIKVRKRGKWSQYHVWF